MKNYFEEVNTSFPQRRKICDKENFRAYVSKIAEEYGYESHTEVLEDKHHNLIVGSCEEAEVILTAHYDTPAASLFPNIMMPRNPILAIVYGIAVPTLYALVALGLAYGAKALFSLSYAWMIGIYLAVYYLIFYLAMMCFENKHNYNDNTSGVATLLTAMSIPSNRKIAFVFFDNEEKGLKGSKAFAKAHPEWGKKLLLNLDCVGNGQNLLFIAKPEAEQHPIYRLITECLTDTDAHKFHFFPIKGSGMNSDNKSFSTSVGICACKRAKFPSFYTPRIHTAKDTEVDPENISVLANSLMEAINA
ncbi:MAG: M28 family peptidase [Clostridia bacterium]|nr:M28 family peptidase [Clostridia bacterium]